MRYGVATLTAVLLLLAGIALAGAGHGWVAGSIGCFALAPLGFSAAANGLSRKPSFNVAVAVLALGLALCLAVAVGTASEGEYLLAYIRANGAAGVLVIGLAYVGWLAVAAAGVVRARRVPRDGA